MTADGKFEVYDDFGNADHSLTDYERKWFTPYGLGEMEIKDTRSFADASLNLEAVPFQTSADEGVNDHPKYLAVSVDSFFLPETGTIVLSSEIRASTPGTVPDLIQQGLYGLSGTWEDPASPPAPPTYSARLLQGQQAAVVMNVLDFCSGQLFDWFVASNAAFALVERLPTIVTGNVANADCPNAEEVGIDKMYTQIVREVPIEPEVWHQVDIALTRSAGELCVDYLLDNQPIGHVGNVGIPLDKQGIPFTGTYPSQGPGELVVDQINSVRFGHGLFSLLDAFPFQHPEAPQLSVSIPAQSSSPSGLAGRTRLFGQGARGSFRNFTTLRIPADPQPPRPSEIAGLLAKARASR